MRPSTTAAVPNRSTMDRWVGTVLDQDEMGSMIGGFGVVEAGLERGAGCSFVVSRPRTRRYIRCFASDGTFAFWANEAEDLVDAGNFCKVDVGSQAALLIFGNLLGRQLIIEVAGDQVGIRLLGAEVTRISQSTLSGDPLDSLDQILGKGAFRYLLANGPDFGRSQRVVEPGNQGPQGQSHGRSPRQTKRT